jgi:hypothetical protein
MGVSGMEASAMARFVVRKDPTTSGYYVCDTEHSSRFDADRWGLAISWHPMKAGAERYADMCNNPRKYFSGSGDDV